jgi:ATP-dependent RNA helicase DDX21
MRKRERDTEEEPEEMKQIEVIKTKKRKASKDITEQPLEEEDDFTKYKIDKSIVERLKGKSIISLFDVQKKVYQPVYEGKSVIVSALTGSGKTLSFVLPIIQKNKDEGKLIQDRPVCMVMTPTRELAIQVAREFSDLTSENFKFKVVLIYGGVSMDDQISKLRGGCDIIVGTPGRITDMIERGELKLKKISTVVLDEADKMLSMGFQEGIEDIFNKIYKERTAVQVCLFSATIEKWVKEIAHTIMKDKEVVYLDLVKDLGGRTPKTVLHLGVNCLKNERVTTIADLILCYGGKNKSTIVFVNTKRECNDLLISDKLKQEVQIIHGDINQKQREATIEAFRKGKVKCLVATDVASRGLDIPIVDLVIQSEPPKDVDTYIHRSGRTARAGRSGTCITLFSKYTESLLSRIEHKCKIKIKTVGAPQRNEIVESSIRDTRTSLIGIDESMIKMFLGTASKLVDEFGAENAVSRLLAYISGHTEKMKSRSLLCGAEGWITYALTFTSKFNHLGYIWSFFKKILKDEIKQKIRGLKCYASMDGCAFDYPEEGHEIFEEILYNDRYYGTNYNLSKPETLPEVQEQKTDTYSSNNTHTNGSSNGFNRNNNFDNNRGREYNTRSHSHKPGRMDIFVGNMPFNVDENKLKEFVSSNGVDVTDLEVRFVMDKETNKPKGFGFISVYDKSIYDKILKLNQKQLNSRSLIITESKNNK